MYVVMCDEYEIPEWIFPDPRTERKGKSIKFPDFCSDDFMALWNVIDATANLKETEALEWQLSHCDVGYPHDAPEHVDRINPLLVKALADIADNDRWNIARDWAKTRLQKQPNDQELSTHKKMLKSLCSLTKNSVDTNQVIVLIREKY
ncbi:MAG: hypothetical protein GY795_04690 [Desulfobacterales bacterium]|nr:hypothetical protein [Desulfobacterales bacterium]